MAEADGTSVALPYSTASIDGGNGVTYTLSILNNDISQTLPTINTNGTSLLPQQHHIIQQVQHLQSEHQQASLQQVHGHDEHMLQHGQPIQIIQQPHQELVIQQQPHQVMQHAPQHILQQQPTHQDIVVQQKQPHSHQEIIVQQQPSQTHREIIVQQQPTQTHQEIIVQQQPSQTHQEIIVQQQPPHSREIVVQHHPQSHQEIIVHQQPSQTHQEIIVQQQPSDSRQEIVVQPPILQQKPLQAQPKIILQHTPQTQQKILMQQRPSPTQQKVLVQQTSQLPKDKLIVQHQTLQPNQKIMLVQQQPAQKSQNLNSQVSVLKQNNSPLKVQEEQKSNTSENQEEALKEEASEKEDTEEDDSDEEAEDEIEETRESIKAELGLEIDTSDSFLAVFGQKITFDSWKEFINLFEKYQRKSGAAFKSKNAVMVSYANEKRITDAIPERFVYSNVRMVCVHFGPPGPKQKKGKLGRKKLVGRDCEASLTLGYKRGKMCIGKMNLVHKNHKLRPGHKIKMFKMRCFGFSDESDMDFCEVATQFNVFEYSNNDAAWKDCVDELAKKKPMYKTITPARFRKRINFLIDRYLVNAKDRPPAESDVMGKLLLTLSDDRSAAEEKPKELKRRGRPSGSRGSSNSVRGRGRGGRRGRRGRGRGRGRPSLSRKTYEESDEDIKTEEDESNLFGNESEEEYTPVPTKKSKVSSDTGLESVIDFIKKMDENDREFRAKELELRRKEIANRRKEIELQHQQFEKQLSEVTSKFYQPQL